MRDRPVAIYHQVMGESEGTNPKHLLPGRNMLLPSDVATMHRRLSMSYAWKVCPPTTWYVAAGAKS